MDKKCCQHLSYDVKISSAFNSLFLFLLMGFMFNIVGYGALSTILFVCVVVDMAAIIYLMYKQKKLRDE